MSRFCSSSGKRCVILDNNLVTSYERGKLGTVITSNGTHPSLFVAEIFRNS
jgi:hypothetical protein